MSLSFSLTSIWLLVVSSFTVVVSSFAVGGSFIGVIVMVTVAVFELVIPSVALYVNVSVPW